MEGNQFRRLMIEKGIPEQLQFIFMEIFEQQRHCLEQVDKNNEVLLGLANSVQGFVALHGRTQEGLQRLMRDREGFVRSEEIEGD